jgi:prepilin-type N-terminal cleavage/methylation domain-containing protein
MDLQFILRIVFPMNKAFTLIELLVVVAIIGILAAVGVVAYNGYTGAAKVNVVKQNHQKISKLITAELMRCLASGEIATYWSTKAAAKDMVVLIKGMT